MSTPKNNIEKYFQFKKNQLFKPSIISSFQALNKDCNKTKKVCYQSFNDCLKLIQQILTTKDVNRIHKKAHELKKDVERCFFIYRTLGNALKKYQTQLRHLIQQQNQAIVDNGTKSVFCQLNEKSSDDFERQQVSKREKVEMKNQEKRDDTNQVKDLKIITEIEQQREPNWNRMDQQTTNIIKAQKHKSQRQPHAFIDQQPQEYLPPEKYLQMFCCSVDEVYTRYNKLTPSYKEAYRDWIGYSEEAFHLNHKHMDIVMQEFVKHDWRRVQKMNLSHCKMNTNQWKQLIRHAQLLKNVKVLSIASNDIEEITRAELQKLVSLTGLIVVSKSQKQCRLSSNTWNQLEEYMMHNKNVQVVFYQQPI